MSEALIVAVRVTPRSSHDAVEEVDAEGAIRLRVTAAPADGAANKAALKLLARTLGLPKGAVSLVSGAASRHKRVRIEGVTVSQVTRRWPGASIARA